MTTKNKIQNDITCSSVGPHTQPLHPLIIIKAYTVLSNDISTMTYTFKGLCFLRMFPNLESVKHIMCKGFDIGIGK